jgi:hypothetical protein
MSEVDPDPYEPAEGGRAVELGGHDVPEAEDPTRGGKRGEIGDAPSITADEADVDSYPAGGGRVAEEPDAAPVADPGPDA